MRHLVQLFRDKRGVGAIEYALVASLISIAAVSAFGTLGEKVDGKFGAVNQALSDHI